MPPELMCPPTERQTIVAHAPVGPAAITDPPATTRRPPAPPTLVMPKAGATSPTGKSGVLLETCIPGMDLAGADPLADAGPMVGATFLGFKLLDEIGRGSFSRVYLAQQGALADRPVVVKITSDARQESNALARLRHPNIVPIHSVHRAGRYHLVCMPYLGEVTLVDVYRDLEGMHTLPNFGRDLFTTLNTRRSSTVRPDLTGKGPPSDQPPPPPPPLLSLEGRSYVEAVLWLAARLADGLAHAHAAGVVHRDLKPANVLLTDDGQPMLLDFNLAATARPGVEEARGGTPHYMSPEQLAAFLGGPGGIDARTDLYSLGVMLYELLTRRSPFTRSKTSTVAALQAMVAERQGPPPRLRNWNPLVSPAVEAIVRRCLEPDPAARYQSAEELKADVELHLADRPLKYAKEPSARERVRKWRRRNRHWVSGAGLATAVAAAAVVAAVGYATWGGKLARLEAADTYRAFNEEAQTAQILLLDRGAEAGRQDEGIRASETALARYGALDRPDWWAGRAVRNLPPADQERVRERAGETLILLSKATARKASAEAGRADPRPALERALSLTDAARACFDGRDEPQAVREHRAELARLLGRPDGARPPAGGPPTSASDRFLVAHQYAADGECRKALPLLRELTTEEPQHFVAWFIQGVCHLELLQDAAAVGCFNSCVALRPDYHGAWYNRGLAARRQGQFDQARADFERVVALRPDFALGYMNRALARHELKDYAGAIDDYTRTLELQGPATSALLRRASARRATGDAAAAADDVAEAFRREPTDVDGYVDRGLARVNQDALAALADFEAALRLNPREYRGLQNKAAILSDKFGRDADAVQVLDLAVRQYPEAIPARTGRGVLLARAGRPDLAIQDAKVAAGLDASPATLYQSACIYALVSASRPEYRPQALHLLSTAVRQGYGRELFEQDPDLKGLRGEPGFRELVMRESLATAR